MTSVMSEVVRAARLVAKLTPQMSSNIDRARLHLLDETAGDERKIEEVVEEFTSGNWPAWSSMAFNSLLEGYDETLEAQLGALVELSVEGASLLRLAIIEWTNRDAEVFARQVARAAAQPRVMDSIANRLAARRERRQGR